MKSIVLGLAIIALIFMAFKYPKVDFNADAEAGV